VVEGVVSAAQKVDVLAVINSRRDGWGDLDAAGRSLNEAYLFSLRHPHSDYQSAVQSQAKNLKSSSDSLRCAGRVPVIRRERRRALARIGGAV
jgi:hypothetical protein